MKDRCTKKEEGNDELGSVGVVWDGGIRSWEVSFPGRVSCNRVDSHLLVLMGVKLVVGGGVITRRYGGRPSSPYHLRSRVSF